MPISSILKIQVLCLILFSVEHFDHSLKLKEIYTPIKKPTFLKEKIRTLRSHKLDFGLIIALNTGDKRYLSKKIKGQMKSSGLLHLVTPSGLHLSSIFIIFKILKHFCHDFLIKILKILFCLSCLMMPGMYSLQRAALFHILLLMPKMSFFKSLIVTFTIDFTLGSYLYAPVSYLFSLLFWSMVYFMIHNPPHKNFFALVSTMLVAQIGIGGDFNLIGPLVNLIISPIFSFLFPFIVVGFWLPTSVTLLVNEVCLILQSFMNIMTKVSLPVASHCGLLLALYIVYYRFSKFLLLFVILLHCESLNFIKKKSFPMKSHYTRSELRKCWLEQIKSGMYFKCRK